MCMNIIPQMGCHLPKYMCHVHLDQQNNISTKFGSLLSNTFVFESITFYKYFYLMVRN